MFNSSNYCFGVNETAFIFPMPSSGWVYCVMNVYPDHMDVYENGSLTGSHPLNAPIRNSPHKLCIGNFENFHHYIGGISEIAIANKAISSEAIQHTTEAIRQEQVSAMINGK
jgi:hypothetical protein